jgi:hypothetical protein
MKVSDCKSCVGPGWGPLLDELHAELQVAYPDYEAEQVKEKFGILRVYVTPSEADGIVVRYENRSGHICEECGRPGRLRKGGWLRTLCDECRVARGERDLVGELEQIIVETDR